MTYNVSNWYVPYKGHTYTIMDIKGTFKDQIYESQMLENSDYYKYIFKKTEKIVCAVFYILRSDNSIPGNDPIVKDLEQSANVLLNTALVSLRATPRSLVESATSIRHGYIELEAKLRLSHAAHLMSTDLLSVFLHEIDSVQRSLNRYAQRVPLSISNEDDVPRRIVTERKVPKEKTRSDGGGAHEVGVPVLGGEVSRREKVIQVIREKGQATIKDISDVIKDCSEKTIQRELVALINDNMIVREGDRRWSRYSLI